MDNATIADNFSLLSKLMDIHGENSFKSKTYSIAAYNIEKMPVSLQDTPREKLFSIKGIGDSVGKKVVEMLDTGHLQALNNLISSTPPGVIEMLQIKGIGPKKIHTIWKEMEIESIGELLYACNENRLTLFKGFGEKTQQNVVEAIHFYLQNQGHFLFAELEAVFPQVDGYLKKMFGEAAVHVTGAYRRQEITIEEMEFVVMKTVDVIKPAFQTAQPPELLEETATTLRYKLKNGLKLKLYHSGANLPEMLFNTSGSPEFLEKFHQEFPALKINTKADSDEDFFTKAKLAAIPAFYRESAKAIDQARNGQLPDFIQATSVKGLIHSHSNWSDGSNTIEEMARDLIRRGFEYLVISDHSKAAAYANGLSEERIVEQHRYVDSLNKELAPFRIFKSIECDILNDGSLDYRDEVLASFDLIIASVHSNLKMNQEKAMMRVMRAIENPFTSILGHMTGRLLLSRNGYPLDHIAVIDACATHQVVIELNAHPRRLDIDWKWIDYALQKNVLISVNPDAHTLDGFDDIRYGILAAQKGGLTAAQNLSSFSLAEFEQFLAAQRKKRS